MPDEDVARYQRLLEARPDMVEMLCWTVVQPLTMPVTVAEVVRRLGGNADDVGLQPVGCLSFQTPLGRPLTARWAVFSDSSSVWAV